MFEVDFFLGGEYLLNDDEGAKYRDFAVDLNPDTGEAMGLCGGMATLAKDFYNAGLPVPDRRSVPYPSDTDAFEDELYNAIWYRLYDTFGGPALVPGVYDNVIKDMDDGYLDKNLYHPIASEQCDLEKMLWWMGEYEVEGEGGLHERTKPEVEKMIARVDQGQLVDIFIMKQNDPSKNWEVGYMTEVGKNHQVLVHDYEITEENQISLRVYEPNAPLSDNEKINIFYDNDGNIVTLTKTGNDTYKVLGIFIGKHVFGSKIPSDKIIKELAL